MSGHVSEELPRLLTGEASRDAVLGAAAHLRTCVDCQHELVSAVVAHASLTSAHRFGPGLVSGLSAYNFAELSRIDKDEPPERGTAMQVALPDLSDMFAQVRREAAQPQLRAARKVSSSRYLIGAAAATVLVGAGAVVYVGTSGDTSGRNSATRTVRLEAYDQGRTAAEAKIDRGGTVSINASSLPQIKGKRYEVWLTDSGRTKMQPVGWLGANGTAAMTVPTDLLSQYRDIEVSVQQVDASSYKYSGTSVLRGTIS